MSSPLEQNLEANMIAGDSATAPFHAGDFQANGAQLQAIKGSQQDLPAGLPPAACVFEQSIGIGATALRTPAVEAEMARDSAEANKLFPNQPETMDPAIDFILPSNAAYRYMMDKEGLDDYSQLHSADVANLQAASPGSVQKLDAFVAAQIKAGLVPTDAPKNCAS